MRICGRCPNKHMAKGLCGSCYQKEYRSSEERRAYYISYDRSWHGRFTRAKSTAKRRLIVWELTQDHYKFILGPDCCHYCSKTTGVVGTGLDRKDNTLGYTIDNVVPCCGYCNGLKSNKLSYLEMVEVSKLLSSMREDQ